MDTTTLSSLLIPMQQKPLLVPAVCVVDIIDYSRPTGKNHPEDWYLGDIVWRGQQIPLIAFERLNQRRFAEFSASARLAVFNTMTEGSETAFYGMVIQGLPQSIELQFSDIQTAEADVGVAEKTQVIVNELPSCIPDLELVDEKLKSLTHSLPGCHLEHHPTDTASV